MKLFHEDCPDRWETVAAIVGGGKSAEDVKNYDKDVGPHKRYKDNKNRRGKARTTLLNTSLTNFREMVMQFTGVEAERRRKSSAEISDVLKS